VPHEVLAWTTIGKGTERPEFERVTPLRHMIIKSYKTGFHRAQQNFVKLALFDEPSENIDGEAILWGAQRLAFRARRAGKRPLMIVFSDGEPLSTPEDPSVLHWHLAQAIRRTEDAGIPLLGVGIQTDAVEQFYARHTVIDDLSDLIGTFYRVLHQELRQSRKVVHHST
jgi:cobalamin biosynthesis protein CobT